MRSLILLAALAAGGATAAPLLDGALVTGSAIAGPATALLGADGGYAAGPGSETTAVLDDAFAQEFVSDDFALIVDFGTDGTVRFFDNGGSGLLAGTYELIFDFSGLAGPLAGLVFGDAPAGGSFSGELLGPASVRFVLSDVDFGSAFGSVQASLVPEPGTLLLAGLGLSVLVRQRRHFPSRG